MSVYRERVAGHNYRFDGLVDVLAKSSLARSGDVLAGCAAESEGERAAAASVLADLPLRTFLDEPASLESDDLTRLNHRPARSPSVRAGSSSHGEWTARLGCSRQPPIHPDKPIHPDVDPDLVLLTVERQMEQVADQLAAESPEYEVTVEHYAGQVAQDALRPSPRENFPAVADALDSGEVTTAAEAFIEVVAEDRTHGVRS